MNTNDTITWLRDQAIRAPTDILKRGLKRAADTLEELAEKNRWISVEERLPEEGGRYLCNVKSFAFRGSFYQAILRYDKYGFVEGHIYTDDVTHWRPLPEEPKEVQLYAPKI